MIFLLNVGFVSMPLIYLFVSGFLLHLYLIVDVWYCFPCYIQLRVYWTLNTFNLISMRFFVFCCFNSIFHNDNVFIASFNIENHGKLCCSPFKNISAFNNISVISSCILFNYFSSFDVSFLIVVILCIFFARCSTLPFSICFFNCFL